MMSVVENMKDVKSVEAPFLRAVDDVARSVNTLCYKVN